MRSSLSIVDLLDTPGVLFPVWPCRGVAAFPKVLPQLADTLGFWPSAGRFNRYKVLFLGFVRPFQHGCRFRLGLNKKSLNLLLGQNFHFFPFQLWELAAHSWVGIDQLFLHNLYANIL